MNELKLVESGVVLENGEKEFQVKDMETGDTLVAFFAKESMPPRMKSGGKGIVLVDISYKDVQGKIYAWRLVFGEGSPRVGDCVPLN